MNQTGPVEPQRHSISAYLMKLPYFPFWQKKDFPFEVLWCLAVALQIAVVFAAPLFPSQDGPMHLYYVEVLRSVLTGKGAHTKYYALHHPLPPYLFQYALTLLMECFWTPLVAEKIMVALYAVWFAIATRYLARSIGPGWRLAALISVAFALNRWVYMGFFNFNAGLATALFLIGYWSRHARPVLTLRKALVFSLVLALLATMHPVPVLFVVGYVVLYTIAAWFRTESAVAGAAGILRRRTRLRSFSVLLPFLLCIAIGFWIHAIATPLRLLDLKASVSVVNKIDRVRDLARLFPILPLTGNIYRKSVALVLGMLVLLCAPIIRKKRTKAAGEQLKWPIFLTIAASLAIYIVAPNQISGGSYFPHRFCIFAFVLGTMSLAFSEARERAKAFSMAGAALLILIIALPLWNTNRALAKDIAPFLNTPLVPPGSRGAYVMEAGSWPTNLSAGCNFSAGFHIAMHLFRQSQIVLLNPPWNALPTTPVVTRDNYPWTDAVDKISPDLVPLMAQWNATSSKDHIDFFVVIKQHGSLPPRVKEFVRMAGLIDIAGNSDQFAMLVTPSPR
jgi:hypothetical protein